MTNTKFIEDCLTKNRDYLHRGIKAGASVPPDRLNLRPIRGEWSPAQVFRHLIMSNGMYEPLIVNGLAALPVDSSNQQVRQTFLGKLLSRQAGPGRFAPVPKQFIPPEEPLPETVVEEWALMQARFIEIVEGAHTKDLNKVFMRNPMFKDIRMNMADCFMLLTNHTQRHIEQIESRVATSC